MSREIKFRVWDNQSKCWCGESSHDWVGSGIGNIGTYDKQPWICMTLGGKIMHNDNMGGFVDNDQSIYILQQYTGLKDKNGVEIYEGDILKCKTFDGWFDKVGYYYNREVKHVTACSGESEISGFLYIPVEREVVGNIFENPELLKNVE